MGKGGLALNFVNVIAFPILTGLGVSYGVQIIYNYRVYGSAERAVCAFVGILDLRGRIMFSAGLTVFKCSSSILRKCCSSSGRAKSRFGFPCQNTFPSRSIK